ncbi:Stp1/IreP family PP2C-type Ser/Thr phosphatase [Alkalicella caledoniensis]|uniref:Stp1/IreP family PP2C-type Ser/Thr phosphatase n=1 Tax=Alkalicella caledoniensis TaxID=2731377 RepID=A0A7G9WCD6_ALKCA|nr:Stp1/IreP family PP2C-type Ser/Thr phosphatase [Alkalicella caledoniensis]QNO16348.1 Stp1/IreP family PP2C-type Ser/Thr phosphatase [Alkalicella caledoniensis]
MVRIAAKTHTGLVRENNQDSLCYGESSLGTYLIIADGMGGHNCGEHASKLAVSLLKEKLINSEIIQLKTSIAQVNEEIYQFSEKNETCKGMGTTLTVALVRNGVLNLGHVGDSRAYVLRDNELCQLTTDHSFVQGLLDNGQITQEEAENHPQKNILTQALGTSPDVEIQSLSQKLEPNDIILLCTDGLTNLVTNDEISQVLQENTVEDSAEALLEKALERGATDNITMIIAMIEEVN